MEGEEVGVVAEGSVPAQSLGRGIVAFSVHVRSKTPSPRKLAGNGAQTSAQGGEVSFIEMVSYLIQDSEGEGPCELEVHIPHCPLTSNSPQD
jgi:hypothetical protein